MTDLSTLLLDASLMVSVVVLVGAIEVAMRSTKIRVGRKELEEIFEGRPDKVEKAVSAGYTSINHFRSRRKAPAKRRQAIKQP